MAPLSELIMLCRKLTDAVHSGELPISASPHRARGPVPLIAAAPHRRVAGVGHTLQGTGAEGVPANRSTAAGSREGGHMGAARPAQELGSRLCPDAPAPPPRPQPACLPNWPSSLEGSISFGVLPTKNMHSIIPLPGGTAAAGCKQRGLPWGANMASTAHPSPCSRCRTRPGASRRSRRCTPPARRMPRSTLPRSSRRGACWGRLRQGPHARAQGGKRSRRLNRPGPTVPLHSALHRHQVHGTHHAT